MPSVTDVHLAPVVKESWPHASILIVSDYGETKGIALDLLWLNKPFREADLTITWLL